MIGALSAGLLPFVGSRFRYFQVQSRCERGVHSHIGISKTGSAASSGQETTESRTRRIQITLEQKLKIMANYLREGHSFVDMPAARINQPSKFSIRVTAGRKVPSRTHIIDYFHFIGLSCALPIPTQQVVRCSRRERPIPHEKGTKPLALLTPTDNHSGAIPPKNIEHQQEGNSERRLGLDWREDTSGYLFVKLAGEDENTKIPIKAHRRLHAA